MSGSGMSRSITVHWVKSNVYRHAKASYIQPSAMIYRTTMEFFNLLASVGTYRHNVYGLCDVGSDISVI